MAIRLAAVFIFIVATATTFHYVAAQTSHIVGDGVGWTSMLASPNVYVTWATGKNFTVGDTLVFRFATGQHDVVQVPNKAAYDDCSDDNPVGTIIRTGPANVPLTTTGEVFFICNVGSHCEAGQKLAITVSPATTVPATPTTPGSPPTTPGSPTPVDNPSPMVPPPPPSSSTAVFASGFLTLLAVVVGY